jgi:hypothetical protein
MANKDEKLVTTPKDKADEDKAVSIQTELYLSEGAGSKWNISKDRRAKLQKELNNLVLKLADTNRPGEGSARILDVIKQRADNKVKREQGKKVTSPVELPKSRPKEDHRLPKGASLFRELGSKVKSIFTEKPKMKSGGMAYGKNHMYVAGGSVRSGKRGK